MRACATAFAAVLTFAGAATAEPAKREARRPVAEQKPPVVVELASVDTLRPSATTPAKPSSEPVKRVAPRVTTCRCGDPQPGPDSQER